MVNHITLEDYFKLHGDKGGDKEAAVGLLAKVNRLLDFARADGVTPGIDTVSKNQCASGYRPLEVNAATSNAATKSKHITCHGIDVQDIVKTRDLAKWVLNNTMPRCKSLGKPDLLAECGLYIEDPRWTAGRMNTDPWVHFQDVPPGSGLHVFIPYADIKKNPPQSDLSFMDL